MTLKANCLWCCSVKVIMEPYKHMKTFISKIKANAEMVNASCAMYKHC